MPKELAAWHLSTAPLAFGICHFDIPPVRAGLNTAPLRGAASVVRNRRDVADRLHVEADGLQRADCRLAPRAGALHADLEAAHAERLRRVPRGDGRLGGRERRPLARSLE